MNQPLLEIQHEVDQAGDAETPQRSGRRTTTTPLLVAGVAAFATAVVWAIRANTTVARLTVEAGQLGARRAGTPSVVDLTSEDTRGVRRPAPAWCATTAPANHLTPTTLTVQVAIQ